MEISSISSSAALYSNVAAKADNNEGSAASDAANGVRPESISARPTPQVSDSPAPAAAATDEPSAVTEPGNGEATRNAGAEGGRSTDGTTRNQPRDGLGTLVDISV